VEALTGVAMNLREVEVFRPYGNEVPEELLWAEGMAPADVEQWLAAEMLRIAKRQQEVLGMYAMDRGDGETYTLHGVVVAHGWRKQGLGRWLVGHAIGVAESKGARHVYFQGAGAKRFFANIGFVADRNGQRFDLIPE
jgi:GNAT superfamily N-acetyltransferase